MPRQTCAVGKITLHWLITETTRKSAKVFLTYEFLTCSSKRWHNLMLWFKQILGWIYKESPYQRLQSTSAVTCWNPMALILFYWYSGFQRQHTGYPAQPEWIVIHLLLIKHFVHTQIGKSQSLCHHTLCSVERTNVEAQLTFSHKLLLWKLLKTSKKMIYSCQAPLWASSIAPALLWAKPSASSWLHCRRMSICLTSSKHSHRLTQD